MFVTVRRPALFSLHELYDIGHGPSPDYYRMAWVIANYTEVLQL